MTKIKQAEVTGMFYPDNLNELCKMVQKLQINLLDLRNSGDTAGDKNHIVGHGAYHL